MIYKWISLMVLSVILLGSSPRRAHAGAIVNVVSDPTGLYLAILGFSTAISTQLYRHQVDQDPSKVRLAKTLHWGYRVGLGLVLLGNESPLKVWEKTFIEKFPHLKDTEALDEIVFQFQKQVENHLLENTSTPNTSTQQIEISLSEDSVKELFQLPTLGNMNDSQRMELWYALTANSTNAR